MNGNNINTGNGKLVVMFVMLATLLLGGISTGQAATVELQWDANSESDLAGYRAYYAAGALVGPMMIDVGNQTTATISALDPAYGYSFAVTAYNTSGQESSYSNIVTVAEMLNPTAAITIPANGATVSGSVNFTASASDNVGVTKVEYFLNGTLVGTDTSTPYIYSWNTVAATPGSYTLLVKAYDAAGNVGQSTPVAVTVANDTTAPSVTVSAPVNGATVSGTLNITASATDNVGVNMVEIFVNGALRAVVNSAPFAYNWNTTLESNGSYILTAKAYDAANNATTSSAVTVSVNNIVPDTTAPSASVTAPATGSTVSGTVNVTASASDNVGVSKVEFFVNGTLAATDSSSPYSYSWNTTAVANGTYNLTAKAYDAANNATTSSAVTVSVNNIIPDTTAPSASVTAPATGSTVSGTVSVTASATDNVGVSKVEFFVNGSLAATDSSSPYSYSWNTTAVANGTYNLTAKAYDAANNATTSSAVTVSVNNIIPDTTAPSASVTAPATGSTVSGTVNVTASASDNVGVSKVEFFVNGTLAAADSSSPYSYSWNTTAVANGTYNLTAKAYDAANNATTSSAVTVSVNNIVPDTTAPSASVTAPATGSTVSGTVNVTASASDNVGVSKVEFFVNGTLAATDSSSPFSYSWNTTAVANGTYNLTAKAYDAANNSITSSLVTVNVNNVVVITPVEGDLNGDGIVNVADAHLALKMSSGSVKPTSSQLSSGDVAPKINGKSVPNGKIDTGDAIVILSMAVAM